MNYRLTELHLHTKETSRCGCVSAADSVRKYKDFGYDAVVVTDHFSRDYFGDYYNGTIDWNTNMDRWLRGYRTAKEVGDKCGLKVFLGLEISLDCSRQNDYLVYGITEEMLYEYKELWTMTEAEFKDFADEQGLFFAQAHPYREPCTVCPKEYLHGVEVFNSHSHRESNNHEALRLWLDTELIPICGSDYHDPDALLGCGVRFHGDAETEKDIVDMLFGGQYELIIPPTYKYTKNW